LVRRQLQRLLLGGGRARFGIENFAIDKVPKLAVEGIFPACPPRSRARVPERSAKLGQRTLPLIRLDVSEARMVKKGLVTPEHPNHERRIAAAILLREGFEISISIKVHPKQLWVLRQAIKLVRQVLLRRLESSRTNGFRILANLERQIDECDNNGDSANKFTEISEVFEGQLAA